MMHLQNDIEFRRKVLAKTWTTASSECIDAVVSPLSAPSEKRIFLSGSDSSGTGEPATLSCGDVRIVIDEERLYRAAADLLNLDRSTAAGRFDVRRARELPSAIDDIPFAAILSNQAGLVECMSGHPHVLAALTLDDVLYKVMALLLNADAVRPGNPAPADTAGKTLYGGRLDHICAYIRARLDQPIQLCDLEKGTGMSRRNLQYAFMREFSCTPMQWIRDERLKLAYQKLVNASSGTRVTSVALSCGFDNLAKFSSYFKKRFGELPNQVLNKSLGRKSAKFSPRATFDARFVEVFYPLLSAI